MNDSSVEDERLLRSHPSEQHGLLHWLLLVWPPVAAPLMATSWYLLALAGLGCVGVVLYLLTPVICVVWSYRICRRLAGSSTLLMVFLFTLELVLISAGLLVGTPQWD